MRKRGEGDRRHSGEYNKGEGRFMTIGETIAVKLKNEGPGQGTKNKAI